MADTSEEDQDRLVLKIDPVGPVEVSDLTGSFAALARLYERHYRAGGEPAPKLYVTKLQSGSIIAEIAPYAVLLGAIVATMDTTMIVADFSRRLNKGLRAFSDPSSAADTPGPEPTNEDASDLKEFVKPLAGKKGASLGIKHARYVSKTEKKITVAEYVFDEMDINRATINIDDKLSLTDIGIEVQLEAGAIGPETSDMRREVTLVFEQASRKPGREKGITGDRGIISEISPKSLPVYFKKRIQGLKDQMVKGDVNPLTNNAYVVDVHVTKIGGEPKAYNIMNLHTIMPLDAPA